MSYSNGNSVNSIEFLSDYTESAGSLYLRNCISYNKLITNEKRSEKLFCTSYRCIH